MFVDDMDAHKDRRLDLANELDIKRVKTVWKFIQVLNWSPEKITHFNFNKRSILLLLFCIL